MARDRKPCEVAEILHQAAVDAMRIKLEQLGEKYFSWEIGLQVKVRGDGLPPRVHIIETDNIWL